MKNQLLRATMYPDLRNGTSKGIPSKKYLAIVEVDP
jgi:hypothetical protein